MSSEWTVERHLEAGTERGKSLWHRSAGIVAACGEHSLSVAKTTITFKGPRRGFAGTYRVEDPRIRSIAAYEQVGCGNR